MTRHPLLAADPASTIIGSSHQVKRDYGEQVATQTGNPSVTRRPDVGVLLLVRHGQGSMGTADYDQLSELGHRQARAAGTRLARADLSISQVWCGGLVRQQETARAVLAELGRPLSELRADVRLDEYDPLGVLGRDIADDPSAAATPASRRALQTTLDEALGRWIQGGAGYPEPHGAFTGRVEAAVASLAARPGTTLAVTSAGVIAVACAQLT